MGKPQAAKKQPQAGGSSLSLGLGPLVGKKGAMGGGGSGATAASHGASKGGLAGSAAPRRRSVDAVRQLIAERVQQLAGIVDRNSQAAASKVAAAEAAIHKRATADHAKTSQHLQDSQQAIELAADQHTKALRRVAQVGKELQAATDRSRRELVGGLKQLQDKAAADVAALRRTAGLKA